MDKRKNNKGTVGNNGEWKRPQYPGEEYSVNNYGFYSVTCNYDNREN